MWKFEKVIDVIIAKHLTKAVLVYFLPPIIKSCQSMAPDPVPSQPVKQSTELIN